MSRIRKNTLVAALMVAAMASMAFAQGPLQKRINYSLNIGHSLRMGDYVLPPGEYVLFQIMQSDPNLFGLYQSDLAREPIAMIRTVRIDYQSGQYPDDTKIMLEMDESSTKTRPVLRGWTIPGTDGYEIISVVSKNESVLTRVK